MKLFKKMCERNMIKIKLEVRNVKRMIKKTQKLKRGN